MMREATEVSVPVIALLMSLLLLLLLSVAALVDRGGNLRVACADAGTYLVCTSRE